MAPIGQDLERLHAAYRAAPSSRRFAPLADAYRESGRVAEALEILERGVAAHPSYVSALVLMAQCQLDLGRNTEAEESFARVVELDPENLAAMKYRADRAAGRGDKSQALLLLDRVLEIDPWDREARRLRVDLERAAMQAPSTPAPATWLVEPESEAEVTPEEELGLEPEPDAPAEIPDAEIPIVDLERIDAASEPLDLVAEPEPAEFPAFPEPELPPMERGMAADWGVERHDDRIVVRPRPADEPGRPQEELAGAGREAVPRGSDDFSTLTLARIFESQGYLDRALAIYDDLHRRYPENADVAERLRALQGRLAGIEHPAAAEPESAPAPAGQTESASWRLLDPAALGDAPPESAVQLRDLAAQVRDRDLSRRHTFIGAPPGAEDTPRLETPAHDPAPSEEPDFERFLRYVRSLKR